MQKLKNRKESEDQTSKRTDEGGGGGEDEREEGRRGGEIFIGCVAPRRPKPWVQKFFFLSGGRPALNPD